ncbi:MAG: DUF4252 domain-containing protein [Terriglobales bacterium]
MRKRFGFVFTGLLLVAPLAAQQPRLDLHLSGLAAKASEVNEVSLDGAALKLGMAFLNNDSDMDRVDRELLSKLKGIYVLNYEFDQAPPELNDTTLAPIRQQLQAKGWSRIVTSRSSRSRGNETDEVYVYTDAAGQIQGLAVISREPRELSVVNIVGTIKPEELTQLSGHLGIPKVDVKPKGDEQ